MGAIGQAVESAFAVTGDPPVHGLAGDPEPLGHLSDRSAVQHFKHCLVLCSTTFNSRSIAGVSRIK
jgi:hypothetical protein